MSTPGFVENYPHPFHPVDEDGEPDLSVSVEVFQLRPGDASRLIEWAGVLGYPGADGGALLLQDGRPVHPDGLGPGVRLGDYVLRHPGGALSAVAAEAGLFHRYRPA